MSYSKVLLGIIFITMFFMIMIPSANTTVNKPYVSGTKIYDPSGNLLNLNGWNIRDYYTEEDFKWLSENGYNAVRVAIYWSSIEKVEGTIDWSGLDNTLAWCQKYHLWAWMDFHQWEYSPYFTFFGGQGGGFPAWLVSDGGYTNDASGQQAFSDDFFLKRGYGAISYSKFQDFWSKLVTRYHDNPSVFCWEILNEPMVGATHENAARTACNARYTEMINLIRAIDLNTIICLHHIDTGYNQKQDFTNIFWTKSAYEYGAGTTETSITNYLNNCVNEFNAGMNVPWLISETGCKPDIPTSDADYFFTTLFSKQRQMLGDGQIGWFIWLYGKADSNGGYKCPRNSDGTESWLQPILKNNLSLITPILSTISDIETTTISSTDTKKTTVSITETKITTVSITDIKRTTVNSTNIESNIISSTEYSTLENTLSKNVTIKTTIYTSSTVYYTIEITKCKTEKIYSTFCITRNTTMSTDIFTTVSTLIENKTITTKNIIYTSVPSTVMFIFPTTSYENPPVTFVSSTTSVKNYEPPGTIIITLSTMAFMAIFLMPVVVVGSLITRLKSLQIFINPHL